MFEVGQLVKATCDMTFGDTGGFVVQGDTGIITETRETEPRYFSEYRVVWLTTNAFDAWWVKQDTFATIEEFKHEEY